MLKCDHLVIGSGIAGLSFAIKTAISRPDQTILIITKSEPDDSNTTQAQGGLAAELSSEPDKVQQHIQDTLEAGDGLCNERIVELVVKEAPERLRELLSWGAHFDSRDGELHLVKEGGHSSARIIHKGDRTGREISRALLAMIRKLKNISVLNHHFAVDLIIDADEKTRFCIGAQVLDIRRSTLLNILSTNTIIASGGIGQLYSRTTNPSVATGDGIAMAARAGAQISGMEFVQFHPTAFAGADTFLLSEALRGAGAVMRNTNGRRFLFDHHPLGELACRDIVSRAIRSEIRTSGVNSVWLDCTTIGAAQLKSMFPSVIHNCALRGIDPFTQYIPVTPAAHYLCGGIETDEWARTGIPRLFAVGECANTGLHGANRLASNSLSEALVFAHRAYLCALRSECKRSLHDEKKFATISATSSPVNANTAKNKELLRAAMTEVGIVSRMPSLQKALRTITQIKEQAFPATEALIYHPETLELRNMIDCATLVLSQSISRKVNRGVYYNEDLLVGNAGMVFSPGDNNRVKS